MSVPNRASFAPTHWEHVPVFRETFLQLRMPAEAAECLRQAGRRLYRGFWSLGEVPEGQEPLEIALRAAAADLRQMEGFLSVLGSSEDVLSSKELRRAQMARLVSASLARLALTLEAASR